ncbi:E3 ubiquitin-protein ligase DZIP3 [Stylophora pistillata]|uniref:E3 ubiquitin-protein ligase DZIP3 n=1 Tax=Stylophora pistillata TaxID=50429 RepID=A0A2B4S9Z7_STYPI|nr:E3 ubiquitin-protein ligase DZIP3 [Stylophora pistillata]
MFQGGMSSVTPSSPSTRETSNYAQLCRLFVEVGSCVLRDTFDRLCPPKDLPAFLAQNKTKLQTLRKERVLSISQWHRLYPAVRSSVSSRDYDSSLLLCLLRNIVDQTLPVSGWSNLPGSDTRVEADITGIKILRDRVYSHVTHASVDDSKFSLHWNDIKETFVRIGGAHYENVINDLKIDHLEADFEEHYRELFREWLKDDDCITDKNNGDKTVKKASKEEVREGSIGISGQQSGMEEVVLTPVEKKSAENCSASPPEISEKLPTFSDLPNISHHWNNIELPVDILLLTEEDCEFLSCFAYLKEPIRSYNKNIGFVYFGCIGDDKGKKMKIALMRCPKGLAVPGDFLSVLRDAISLLRPKVIFSVGACSGFNSRKVKLGDVVVSSKLISAAPKTPPSREIGNLIKYVADGWKAPLQNADEYNAKVHCDGVVLSISEANKDMIGQHPEAIAVEMEGVGSHLFDFKMEWVFVKGIKDFVDDRHSSSEKWTQIACVMAASVVANILSDPVIFQDWRHFTTDTSESHTPGNPGKGSFMATAPSPFVSTKETANYAMLCRLLVSVGSQVLRSTFDKIHPPATLRRVLGGTSVHYATLQSLYKGKKKVLNSMQWAKLYPAHSPVSSATFDITLLTVLLRNICGLSPPATGWDHLPPASNTSIADDIARLKYYRNTVHGHASQASVDDISFSAYWLEIREALVRLGGAHFQASIDNLEHDCMDRDIEEHYCELMKQWKKDDDSIKDKLEEIEGKENIFHCHMDSHMV